MELESKELLHQGMAYMAAENYELAADTFRKATKVDPQNVDALAYLGNACACIEQFEEAIKAFKTALLYKKDDGQLLYSLGGIYLLKNDFASAIRYYNRAEKSGYRTVEMYIIISGVFAESEDYPQAIRAITNAIKLAPLRGDLYVRKANMQIQFNMLDDAVDTLEELKELIPDALNSYDLETQIFCEKKEFEKAKEVAQQALARFPDELSSKLLMLRVLTESGNHPAATNLSEEMLREDPSGDMLQQIVMYRATSFALQEDTRSVINTLEGYANINSDPQALFLLMNTYLIARDYAGVKSSADRMLKLEIEVPIEAAAKFYRLNAEHNISGIDAVRSQYKKLVSELRSLSLKSPQNYEIYIYRLLCYVELGDFEKAIELSNYLENAYPELPDGHLYRHHIYKRMGLLEKANIEKEKALHIAPQLRIN